MFFGFVYAACSEREFHNLSKNIIYSFARNTWARVGADEKLYINVRNSAVWWFSFQIFFFKLLVPALLLYLFAEKVLPKHSSSSSREKSFWIWIRSAFRVLNANPLVESFQDEQQSLRKHCWLDLAFGGSPMSVLVRNIICCFAPETWSWPVAIAES